MRLSGKPVGIFQTYEPAADPIGEHYPVRDGDFGIHLFLAPAEPPVPGFTGAVAGALLRFAFAHPGTKRIVVEPDARNERALVRWQRLGFVFGDEVVTPREDRATRLLRTRQEQVESGDLAAHRVGVPVPDPFVRDECLVEPAEGGPVVAQGGMRPAEPLRASASRTVSPVSAASRIARSAWDTAVASSPVPSSTSAIPIRICAWSRVPLAVVPAASACS